MSCRPKRKIIISLLFLALIAVFFGFVYVFGFPPDFFKKMFLSASRPLMLFKNRILQSEENPETVLKLGELFCDLVMQENKELKTVLSVNTERELIAAAILLRPGYGLYNSLLVEAGSDQGIKEGMMVTAFGNILLGRITDVMPKLSRVRLISYPEEETNIFINNLETGIAVGRVSENLEITLPYESVVNIGDKITSLGNNYLLLGIVEKIEKDPADPFQKIIFRLPVNIQELRNVYIVK